MATKKKPAAKAKPAAKKAAKPAKAARAKPATKSRRKASPIPKGFHSATPYLVIRGAADALAFYAKAFGARATCVMKMPDGSVMHAEMKIGDSMLMLSEENLQWGSKSPTTLGGSATHVMLYVKDVDASIAKAVSAGATIAMPAADQFWGDRYGKITDPFGHVWSVATHLEDMTPKQLQERADEAMKQMSQQG
jgi:PhnB protein